MTDWERLDSMEDQEIDFSDCPEITPAMLKTAIIRRGSQSSSKKQALTLYLDEDIIAWYKSNEESHQSEINSLLKEYLKKTSS